MTRYIQRYCAILALCLLPSFSYAQSGLFGLGGGSNDSDGGGLFGQELEEPAADLPPLPKVEEAPQNNSRGGNDQGYGMEFPELPPSRLCRKRDILGMWKLQIVFEVPAALELEDFGEYPYQYIMFNGNDTFRIYKSSYDENAEADILRDMVKGQSNVLEQFVVHKVDGNSVIYLYKDGVAIYNVACFIVADPQNPFSEGQMLFMPPPERATTRMVKAYTKVFDAPKKKKKRKKRRHKKKNR